MYNIIGIWGKVWTDVCLVQKGKQEDKKGKINIPRNTVCYTLFIESDAYACECSFYKIPMERVVFAAKPLD